MMLEKDILLLDSDAEENLLFNLSSGLRVVKQFLHPFVDLTVAGRVRFCRLTGGFVIIS